MKVTNDISADEEKQMIEFENRSKSLIEIVALAIDERVAAERSRLDQARDLTRFAGKEPVENGTENAFIKDSIPAASIADKVVQELGPDALLSVQGDWELSDY